MTQNVHLPPLLYELSVVVVVVVFFARCFCCFQHYYVCTLVSFCFRGLFETRGERYLNTSSLATTGNYLQRMEKVRGKQIALWDVTLREWKMSIGEGGVFIHCAPLRVAGGSVAVFTFSRWNVGVFVCLCHIEWFAAHWRTLLCTNCRQMWNMSLAIIPNLSWERREVCRKPVATCHNPPENSREARKKTTCLSKLSPLSNCSTHITGITGLILLYNHRSLFPAYCFLAQFVCLCSHFGYTNVLLSCQPSNLFSRQLNWIEFENIKEEQVGENGRPCEEAPTHVGKPRSRGWKDSDCSSHFSGCVETVWTHISDRKRLIIHLKGHN